MGDAAGERTDPDARGVGAGDVTGDRPGAFSFADRAKYDAWAKLKGTDSTKAMEAYVKLVERLKKSYG